MDVLEILAVILTLCGVSLMAKEHLIGWPIGILSTLALIVVYIYTHIYGQIVLQIVFLIQFIVGWYKWGKSDNIQITSISNFKLFCDIMVFSVQCLLFIMFRHLSGTDSLLCAILDSISVFIALLGNWYIAKKIIQGWLLFMIYDLILITLFIIKDMGILVILYISLFCISILAYKSWKTKLKIIENGL